MDNDVLILGDPQRMRLKTTLESKILQYCRVKGRLLSWRYIDLATDKYEFHTVVFQVSSSKVNHIQGVSKNMGIQWRIGYSLSYYLAF